MVSRRIYWDYFSGFGWFMTILMFGTLGAGYVCQALGNVWLSKWSSSNVLQNSTQIYYLEIYSVYGILQAFLSIISGFALAYGSYTASVRFHKRLIGSLLRSPMAFYDRTPLGRIMNRLSNDIDRVDEMIPWSINYGSRCVFDCVTALLSISIIIPYLVFLILPLFVIFLGIITFYNAASVQYRRINSKAWSFMCSFVQDSYIGSDSIRCYNVVEHFREKACKLADFTAESILTEIIINRWIQVRLDLLADFSVFLFILTAIIMGNVQLITLGALAMVISSGLSFSGIISEIARSWREIEMNIVGVERINEYIKNKPEAEWKTLVGGPDQGIVVSNRNDDFNSHSFPPPNWPTEGRIVFDDFCFRYKPGAPLVLRGLNFTVEAGEKIGIVGRTGAGKTSLTLALFRIVEPASGRILIDDLDISRIGLHDLRKAITIIPQDPVLFCGSLRSNLDPFEEFQDLTIWSAIEKAHLKEFVEAFEQKLNHEISEAGNNLSVGQRQLVCLARALLRQNTKILVLDEATAAIDPETDRLIQLSIRENFLNCTILTIAHRINTVMDYTKILVLDSGEVKEFDTPENLLLNTQSIFASLAREAGCALPGKKVVKSISPTPGVSQVGPKAPFSSQNILYSNPINRLNTEKSEVTFNIQK